MIVNKPYTEEIIIIKNPTVAFKSKKRKEKNEKNPTKGDTDLLLITLQKQATSF